MTCFVKPYVTPKYNNVHAFAILAPQNELNIHIKPSDADNKNVENIQNK